MHVTAPYLLCTATRYTALLAWHVTTGSTASYAQYVPTRLLLVTAACINRTTTRVQNSQRSLPWAQPNRLQEAEQVQPSRSQNHTHTLVAQGKRTLYKNAQGTRTHTVQ
jgi:hypothetical protein